MLEKEAKAIIKKLGGEENIISVIHCATRLRFKLHDFDIADKDGLKDEDYVLSVVESGGQFQVIIGPEVPNYYAAVSKELESTSTTDSNTEKENSENSESQKKERFSIFGFISGAFTPIIPVLAGAGMVKAVLTLLLQVGWLTDTGTTYAVISAAGNSVFYFLPVFLGFTIAKNFGANQFVGAAIGAALLEPSYTSLIGQEGLDFMAIPITPIDYSSSVFPIFIAASAYAFLEKRLKKIVHENLQLFLVPMIGLLVMVPITVIAFGPFGTYVGTLISDIILWLYNLNSTIAGFVFTAAYPFITMLGLHWAFTPVTLNNLAVYGTDVIEGMAVASIWAQIGIAIGIAIKSKVQSKARIIATPTILTGIVAGVTEPILYGLIMQYKRLPIVVGIAGGIGGAINGLLNVGMDSYVFHHIWSIITGAYSPLSSFLIGCGVSLILGILLTITWGITENDKSDFVGVEKDII